MRQVTNAIYAVSGLLLSWIMLRLNYELQSIIEAVNIQNEKIDRLRSLSAVYFKRRK